MDFEKLEDCFMALVYEYEPDDCDDASFLLIELKGIGEGFFSIQFNVNEPKDFIPHVWVGCFVDIRDVSDSDDEMTVAKDMFKWAVEYREKHLMKFIENAKRFESIVER